MEQNPRIHSLSHDLRDIFYIQLHFHLGNKMKPRDDIYINMNFLFLYKTE